MAEEASCWVESPMKYGGTLLKVDNNSTIQLAKNQTYHGCTKHIEVHHHFVREKVERGVQVVEYWLIDCGMPRNLSIFCPNGAKCYLIAFAVITHLRSRL